MPAVASGPQNAVPDIFQPGTAGYNQFVKDVAHSLQPSLAPPIELTSSPLPSGSQNPGPRALPPPAPGDDVGTLLDAQPDTIRGNHFILPPAAEVANAVASQLVDSSDVGEFQGSLPGVPAFSHSALISEKIKEKIWSDQFVDFSELIHKEESPPPLLMSLGTSAFW